MLSLFLIYVFFAYEIDINYYISVMYENESNKNGIQAEKFCPAPSVELKAALLNLKVAVV